MPESRYEQKLVLEIDDRCSPESWYQALVKAGLIAEEDNVASFTIRGSFPGMVEVTTRHSPFPAVNESFRRRKKAERMEEAGFGPLMKQNPDGTVTADCRTEPLPPDELRGSWRDRGPIL